MSAMARAMVTSCARIATATRSSRCPLARPPRLSLSSPRCILRPSPPPPTPPTPLHQDRRFLRIPFLGGRTFHGHVGGGLSGGNGGQSFGKTGAAFKGAREVKGVQMVKQLVAYVWPKDNPGEKEMERFDAYLISNCRRNHDSFQESEKL